MNHFTKEDLRQRVTKHTSFLQAVVCSSIYQNYCSQSLGGQGEDFGLGHERCCTSTVKFTG